ncbi:MAG: ATP-dependent DNA helicase RecG [Thermoanaerobaculia bacterium]
MSTVRKEWTPAPDTPVQYLKGVGEGRAALLAAAGIKSVEDLLYFFPFRYEDRRHPMRICDIRQLTAPVAIRGRVVSCGLKVSPIRQLRIFEAILDDGTGSITLVWFNQPYLAEQIRKNQRLAVYGQPRMSARGRVQIESPDIEHLEADGESELEGTIVPVYPTVSGIPPKAIRKIVQQSLGAVAALDDPLPVELRKRFDVIDLRSAIVGLHYPQEITPELLANRSAAHRRLVLQEFFAFQLALRLRRAEEESRPKGRTISIDDTLRAKVKTVLPFRLTGAQKRVLKEIADDLQSPRPMYRLLQGDVGSGKTIVAMIAAMIAIENGHQAALLAPTEILAEQHSQRIGQLLDGMVSVAKLTGSTPAGERRAILERLASGEVHLLIGTHALLEDPVRFRSLGLAIVDEQHRFGVAQRQRLFEKGELADILVMTATPIPRSLALAMYGDLELSVIDELPPGRERIRTVVRGSTQLPKIYAFIDEQIASGAQAYIVYPIIDESEKLDLTPLTVGYERVREALPGRRVAMLHGRMPNEEKESTMERFKNGDIDILVSTTVIEVGIDVPRATVMVVAEAERYGLSQLHQLRGRIGRGAAKSWCVLVRDERASEESKERLRMFEATADGFEVAEKDLALRGAGDFLGTRQSGIPRFVFGDLLRDFREMETARDAAIAIVRERGCGGAREIVSALMGHRSHSPLARD